MISRFVSKCCKEDCVPFENPIEVNSLAKAYVPMQKICGYFEPKEAFLEGTVFPSLSGLYDYFKEW